MTNPFPVGAIHSSLARVFHTLSVNLISGINAAGANMTGYKIAIFGATLLITGVVASSSVVHAQTFENYRCADGTRFIVGFYPYDSRAHLQIDGRPVTLKKRLAISGKRYSGGGVTLAITKAGTRIRHARRPLTACELT
jgi:membrane-bound inhibitor of C-type lysozyme